MESTNRYWRRILLKCQGGEEKKLMVHGEGLTNLVFIKIGIIIVLMAWKR